VERGVQTLSSFPKSWNQSIDSYLGMTTLIQDFFGVVTKSVIVEKALTLNSSIDSTPSSFVFGYVDSISVKSIKAFITI
jgi:hypothetical protein